LPSTCAATTCTHKPVDEKLGAQGTAMEAPAASIYEYVAGGRKLHSKKAMHAQGLSNTDG